ncbi:MAG: hypothetical protein ACKVHO_14930 [Verrucomicrobiia bacterium]|jgi:hypothetical protein
MSSDSDEPQNPDGEQKFAHPAVEIGLVLLALAFAGGAVWNLVTKWRTVNQEVEQEATLPAEPVVKRTEGPWGLAVEPSRNLKFNGFHNFWDKDRDVTVWFDEVPTEIQAKSIQTPDDSNIRRADYSGSESCRECHSENYNAWHGHAHRLMNAMAEPENMKGDFSGNAEIDYLGGKGTFYREKGHYRMALRRRATTRIYEIQRTIGSRFFQYYIGRLVEGSEPKDLPMWNTQHVLPFGYWIDEKQWVPTVHVFRESNTDKENQDPYTETEIVSYDGSCTACHTTMAAGDWILNMAGGRRLSVFAPRPVSFHMYGYLADARQELIGGRPSATIKNDDIFGFGEYMGALPVIEQAVSLGVSCEACHFGAKKHVENSTKTESKYLPKFFPAGPHIFAEGTNRQDVLGRNAHNLNFACAKCHTGGRPEYASGAHTWNSTEYSDAVRGACYHPGQAKAKSMDFLTCVHCHDPHETTGRKWKRTPAEDDRSCIACHKQFEQTETLTAHTHHADGGAGSHCMNCHMPKINEGLQDMVRTHRILTPTEASMIEANQPNACNLCHLDKPIDWTIGHLRDWYGPEHKYDERKISANYPKRKDAVGLGWIRSAHAPTRLAAAEALALSDYEWALPHLLDLLIVDDNLVHRQFTQKRLEERLKFDFDSNGYTFFMTEKERRPAIEKLRARLLPAK